MTGYLDVDESQIPTGELITFDEDQHGDPMDFRKPRIIDNTIDQVQQFKGYDHFYMLKPPSSVGDGEEEQDLVLAVEVETSEIKMQIFTNQIGFQLYTGNWLDGKIPLKSIHSSNNYSSTSSTGYGKYSGVCFEPSAPPDSINHPQWRDQVIISSSKKHPYKNIILYKFSKVKE